MGIRVIFISKTLPQMPSFLVFWLRQTYAGSHPNSGLKKDTFAAKNVHVLIKYILFKFNFQDDGHLDSNFSIYVLATHRECLIFQFLSPGIRMEISIITGI